MSIEFENGVQGLPIPEGKEEVAEAQTLLIEELARLHRYAYLTCQCAVKMFETANTISVVTRKLEESYLKDERLSNVENEHQVGN